MKYINRLPKGYDGDDVFENPHLYQELSTRGCILRFKNQSEWDNMYAKIVLPDSVIKENKDEILEHFPKLVSLFIWGAGCRKCDIKKKIHIIRKTIYDADFFLPLNGNRH